MRDDVMMELVRRATEDSEFRQQAMTDLEGTLKREGYDLAEDELDAVRELQNELSILSEEGLNERLDEVQRTGIP